MIAASITVAICTRDRYHVLPRAIESLLAQRTAPQRILVIDNSPDTHAARAFAARFAGRAGLDYQVTPATGISMARNAALEATRTPILAFLDDDAAAAPDWVAELLRAFEASGDDAAVVGGRVVPEWESPQPAWLHPELLGYLSLVDWGGGLRPAQPTEWFAGTNIAYRAEALRQAGGFSERLGRGGGSDLLSNEETEAARRMEARGGRRFYQPAACVTHLIPSARLTQNWFRKRAAWQAVSDCIADPEAVRQRIDRDMDAHARRRVATVPLRRLYARFDDAQMFRSQMSAVYYATARMLLGAGED